MPEVMMGACVAYAVDASFALEDEVALPPSSRTAFLTLEFDSSGEYKKFSAIAKFAAVAMLKVAAAVYPAIAAVAVSQLTKACLDAQTAAPTSSLQSQVIHDVQARIASVNALASALQPILKGTMDVSVREAIQTNCTGALASLYS